MAPPIILAVIFIATMAAAEEISIGADGDAERRVDTANTDGAAAIAVDGGASMPARDNADAAPTTTEEAPTPTLMLNMLIKDEEAHLARTLPIWAEIIDYWIIGVDSKNSDASPAVIERELVGRGIPGKMVNVSFDGMGPTWTVLVDEGVASFPDATFGIIADADHAPVVETFNRDELRYNPATDGEHARAPIVLIYSILTETPQGASIRRRIDWMYRNIPGFSVVRRVHQQLHYHNASWTSPDDVPAHRYHHRRISLELTERTGSYQDRVLGAVGKWQRYERLLEADMAGQFAGDPTTMYYLAHAKMDLFMAMREAGEASADELAAQLHGSIEVFSRRSAIVPNGEKRTYTPPGLRGLPPNGYNGTVAPYICNNERTFWAAAKAGECFERWTELRDYGKALHWYKRASAIDPARPYAHYRRGVVNRYLLHWNKFDDRELQGPKRAKAALRNLYKAASLPDPSAARSIGVQVHCNVCARHLDFVDFAVALEDWNQSGLLRGVKPSTRVRDRVWRAVQQSLAHALSDAGCATDPRGRRRLDELKILKRRVTALNRGRARNRKRREERKERRRRRGTAGRESGEEDGAEEGAPEVDFI